MTDTARNLTALQALLLDNASGAISPQDLRDFLVSAQIHGADCWDDMLGDVFNAGKKDGLTLADYRDTDHRMYFFNHNATNTLSLKYQMSHRFNGQGPNVRVHIHAIPIGAGAGNVVFRTKYAWLINNGELPANSGWTSTTTTMAIVSADVYKDKLHHLASVAITTGVAESSILNVTLQRLGSAATDTYNTNGLASPNQSANLAAVYVDVHYPVKKAGSIAEYGD